MTSDIYAEIVFVLRQVDTLWDRDVIFHPGYEISS